MIAYQGPERYAPPCPSGGPHRGQGKRKLHLLHIEPCASHAFLAFFVDGQSQLGQLNIKSLTSENTFLWQCFITLLLKQVPLSNSAALVSFKLLMNMHCFHSGSILRFDSNLASGININLASVCGLDNLKW